MLFSFLQTLQKCVRTKFSATSQFYKPKQHSRVRFEGWHVGEPCRANLVQ